MAIQPNPNDTLTGGIANGQGERLEGLIVRVHDQDPNALENPLGEAVVTDAERRYEIGFTEKDSKAGGVEGGGPDVLIRVYDGNELLEESPVKRNFKERITSDLRVDYVEADPLESMSSAGTEQVPRGG